MNRLEHMRRSLLVGGLVITLSGCGEDPAKAPEATVPVEPSVPEAAASPAQMTVSDLRRALKANDNAKFQKAGGRIIKAELYQSGVTDISPLEGLELIELDLGGLPIEDLSVLRGMPLRSLVLEATKVQDLSVLRGMPLEVLKIQSTPVTDLSPLKGMRLRQLNLMDTAVTDLSITQGMPLETLWIPLTKVNDLTPLAGTYLESLDCQDTPVSDLRPLSGMRTLKRLNIAGSAVTDLTPLRGLQLERLVFSPERIQSGIEVVREMTSIQTLGPNLQQAVPAAQFWQVYDIQSSNN